MEQLDKTNLKEYYKSVHWRKLSESLLDDKECECALCHRKRWKFITRGKNKNKWKRVYRFAVHHLKYDNVYKEQEHLDDLMILCSTCHNLCHDIFRYRNISLMYTELANVIQKFGFIFNKESTS